VRGPSISANRDTTSARQYHDRTAHSPESVRRSGHVLDWETKPLPFKVYPALEQIRLPTDLPALAVDTFTALAPGDPPGRPPALDLERLAGLLFFSAGVTRVKTYPGGAQVHFRAAASTGALYQTEAYVVAGAVEGLEPGVYHFSPGDFCLRRLRPGDFRGAVALAAADDAVAAQPAAVILSAISPPRPSTVCSKAWKLSASVSLIRSPCWPMADTASLATATKRACKASTCSMRCAEPWFKLSEIVS